MQKDWTYSEAKLSFCLNLDSSMQNCFDKIFNFLWERVAQSTHRAFLKQYLIGSYLPGLGANSFVVFVYNEYLTGFFNSKPYKDNKSGHWKCPNLMEWKQL